MKKKRFAIRRKGSKRVLSEGDPSISFVFFSFLKKCRQALLFLFFAIFFSVALAQTSQNLPAPQSLSRHQHDAEVQRDIERKARQFSSDAPFTLPKPITSKRAQSGYQYEPPVVSENTHVAHNKNLPSPSITMLAPHLTLQEQQAYRHMDFKLNEDLHELLKSALPSPKNTPRKPLHLSLREAILLTLRNQPGVINDELDRVKQKFALIESHWSDWEPKYTLSGTTTLTNGARTTYSLGSAKAEVKTPIGTDISYEYTHNNIFTPGSQGGSTVTISQPLLKGFGWAVNTADWYNALDTEEANKLNFKGQMIAAVVSTIKDYRSLVEQYNQLDVDKEQLEISKEALEQSRLRLKAGQIAKSDFIQQQAQYKTQQVQYINSQSAIFGDYAALLKDLGLDANAQIVVDKKIQVSSRYIPKLNKAVQLALEGNIDYQTALINLRATERTLITAKNNALWTLTATYTSNIGGTAAGAAAGASGSVTALTWSIPIHQLDLQQAILNARIDLQKARLSLEETRMALVRTVKTAIITLHNDWQEIQTAQEQVDLQNKTVANIRLKIKYGQSTVFELNTEQQNLINYQNSLISSQVTFMNGLTDLYQTLGLTLDIWHIKLRY